ncbi:unnamed protein product [Nezara viridula]|uniref:Multivesicular body subunit 12A n=1 Tax=Nezara viridula TaxID=85310 RepID=A0A9P0HGL7_NEZVI|nr:unnamed protein product [Nezara viridula]
MMQQIIKTFPDDKPLTSISVIEDISKRPQGFIIVSKTFDQDSDADLWKGSTFFGGRVSRYLCLSKTEGIDNYIVEDIAIIGEKDMPPDGYGLIPKTMDTDAKAWKKRQICYKLTRRNLALSAVTDIILLSKSKKAPEGFSLAGDINGVVVCFKTIHDLGLGPHNNNPPPVLGYSLNPKGIPQPTISPSPNGLYPAVASPTSSGDYVNLLRPKRPAPTPPIQSSPGLLSTSLVVNSPPEIPPKPQVPSSASYATLKVHEGLEGIPFVLHPTLELIASKGASIGPIPVIKRKTMEDLDREYAYDFRLERQST